MSLFEAYNQQQAQQSYVPQQRANLQTAYNQALGQRTPNWAIHLSNAMPSIAEIIAAGTTKGAFNQGRIADSLERQKNRQIAYTQALQNMEDNRVKDYVQMAKDQLNLDIANEERAYNRQQDALKFAYQKALDEWNQNFKKEGFDFEKDKFGKLYDLDVDKFNWDKDKFDKTFSYTKEKDEADKIAAQEEAKRKQEQEQKEAEAKALAEQQKQEQAQKEAEAKANQEQMKKNQERVFTLLNNNSVSPETAMVINNNPELYKYLKDDTGIKNIIPIIGSKKKLELDYKAILKDKGIEKPTEAQIKALKKELGL